MGQNCHPSPLARSPGRAAAPACTPAAGNGPNPLPRLALRLLRAQAHRSGRGAKTPVVDTHNPYWERAGRPYSTHSASPPAAPCLTIGLAPHAVLPPTLLRSMVAATA